MTTRREFIGASAAVLGASAAGASSMIKPADEKLDILFLGGTGFLGPHKSTTRWIAATTSRCSTAAISPACSATRSKN
jgi:hypothetical protein